MTQEAIRLAEDAGLLAAQEKRLDEARQRLRAIDSMTMKLYEDMYAGRLEEDRAHRLLKKYRDESDELNQLIQTITQSRRSAEDVRRTYDQFFALTERYTHVEQLTREILTTFIDRIEIEPKRYPPGVKVYARSKVPYEQKIHIYYKFIGEKPEIALNLPA